MTITRAVEAGARAAYPEAFDDPPYESEFRRRDRERACERSEKVIRAALSIVGEELAQEAWLQSRQGATHDQIAAALRLKIEEMGR